ncbi:MAG: geranylgeranyl reductase family protein [Bacteroidota bacterium]
MNKSVDVAIVGAGPGGSTCALALEHSGLSVALIEREVFPRDKICGDALSGKVIDVLRKIAPEAEQALHQMPDKLGSHGIRFLAPSGELLDVPFRSQNGAEQGHPPGYISRRLEFDEFMARLAASKPNVDLLEGQAVKALNRTDQGVEIELPNETLHTKIVIGADGAHSVVNKTLGSIKVEKSHYSAGVRAYYKGVTGFHNENFIELHYIKDLVPGYFWIFPLPNGRANVGLGMLSRDVSKGKVNLKERLLDVVQNHPEISARFKDATLEGKVLGFGLPLGSKRRPISGERFMLIGDAASLIDPFSGEGIGNAMLSGQEAAIQAVKCIQQEDFSAEFIQAYDAEVYRRLWTELALSRRMQQLAAFPWLFDFVVKKANRNSAIQEMMTMMFENLDIRAQLRKPSFYAKLLLG